MPAVSKNVSQPPASSLLGGPERPVSAKPLSPEDEINAQLIAQMMEDDANEIAAQAMQNEAFGGGGMGGGMPQPTSQNAAMVDEYDDAGVRQADQQQEQ